ncbi:DUF4130 domain-containing protein [uncultured Gilliamella sp.]|nr:DUF4130 domain-containing protein [Gilliamella sp. B3172]QYN46915.1 DUF4130 domain-containing protein [Gilliamella sp. ESL0405]
MWHRYSQALTIKERVNPKLQRQQMPRRFCIICRKCRVYKGLLKYKF